MPNSPICVDASVVIRLLVPLEGSPARQQWEQWFAEGRQIIAPTLLHYEVNNTLHQYRRSGQLSNEAVQTALRASQALPVVLHGDFQLHTSALDFAAKHELNATYDAHYLALADREGADFWTADRRLWRRVQPTLPWVYLLG